ncbi:hypothetical protein ACFOOM_01145 [Streptomyces echinoruber]|uniref:Uncharacterized protein n=1 Tax=Streptomyces echinoruber TaxID=68898 RepID=A0A918V7K6_9ACTN|nr:hypothetical protein [Streptomyces echinoruber]GGZ73017.1 hypothetical protein GCM10010389_08040 [Streptomyces echinoruber]
MGAFGKIRSAFGGGRPTHWPPSTREIEQQRKAQEKAAAQSAARRRRHKALVARKGDRAGIPFDR